MIKIKPFKEKPGQCGPASLKMVASYYGIEKSEDELANLCKCTPEKGTSAENLVKAAKELSLEGFIQDNSDIKDIEKYVKNEIPVILNWFCKDAGHYSVAVDVDEKNIYLQDGYYGRLIKKNVNTFKGIWFDFKDEYPESKDDFILRRMIVLFTKKRSYQKEVVSRLEALANKLNIFKVGDITFEKPKLSYPFYGVIAESPNPNAHTVFLSAGVHGDEPAAVYALLKFLENKVYDYLDHFSFIAFPCLNPSGFELDVRKNFDGVNINCSVKDDSLIQEVDSLVQFLSNNPKKYLFTLDMHEDPTDKPVEGSKLSENPRSFYMYEVSPDKESQIGPKIIQELEKDGIPVCKLKKIYKERSKNGIIWSRGLSDPCYNWRESIEGHMQKYTANGLTIETPTCWPLEDRIATHLKVLTIALEEFKKN